MEKQVLPLTGVKVVELSTVVAAPTTARMLCAYGADVVKIEARGGDAMRRTGKIELTPYDDDQNPLFTVHNSNKKLICLNFKTPAGKKLLLELIGKADVFITNVREKSLKNSGLDYETLKEKFPQLIYAHFSGYGPKGPAAGNPGFDITAFWLRSGPIADWQVKGAFPFTPTYAFGDMATSSAFLSGILMALLGRQRTGKGTKVETSLFASGIWCNSVDVVASQFERREMNPDPFHPDSPFDHYYLCKDEKWIGIFTNEYVQDREKFARILGMEDILTDPRYDDIDTLNESGAMVEAVERCNKIFLTKTSAEWKEILSSSSISCEVMQHTYQIASDPQAIANGYVEPVEYAGGLTVMMPCPPISFSEYGRRSYQPTGRVGADTEEVLCEMGCSEEEIAAMREAGAVD